MIAIYGAMNTGPSDTRASDRAEVHAPRPSGGSIMGGVCVAVVVFLGVMVVSGFYGWEVRDNILLACLIVAAGFCVGLVGYKGQKRKNLSAVGLEQSKIDRSETA